MSASREKKTRQEKDPSILDPKTAREAAERKKQKRSDRMYAAIFIVFLLVAAIVVTWNSGILQKRATAVTINGEKYTAAEVNYYYSSVYNQFLSSYGSYASMFGLDTSKSLKSQNYSEDKTWDEYFKEQAVSNMKFIHAILAKAEEENMTLDDEDMETFNTAVENLKSQATQYGYSYKSYLRVVYGSTMTASVFEQNLKDQILADKYASAYQESLSFTDEEIQAYYEENKNSYDLVNGEYVSISGSAESTTDEEGNTVEPTEEEKTAAMEAAKETAEKIMAAYENGGDLEALAEEYGATYTSSDEMTYSSTYVYGDWFFDESRTAGDAEVLEDTDYSRYFVAVFHDRKQDTALDYNVRHILVTADNLELAEGEEATDDMILAKAEEILDSWDGTEEGFAELAKEYSQDGNAAEGGLYENVAKGAMVSEFEDWCYEAGRKSGDTGIVKSSYGQHIMYFVGYGDTPYWYYACNNALINNAYSEWQTETTESVTAEVNEAGMAMIG